MRSFSGPMTYLGAISMWMLGITTPRDPAQRQFYAVMHNSDRYGGFAKIGNAKYFIELNELVGAEIVLVEIDENDRAIGELNE